MGRLLDPAEEIRCDFPNLGIASPVAPDNSNHPYRSPTHTVVRAPVHPPSLLAVRMMHKHMLSARCCNLSSGTRCTSHLTDPDPASRWGVRQTLPFITQVGPTNYDSDFLVIFLNKLSQQELKVDCSSYRNNIRKDLIYLKFLDKEPTIGWKQEDQKSTRSAGPTYADKGLFLKRNAVNDVVMMTSFQIGS